MAKALSSCKCVRWEGLAPLLLSSQVLYTEDFQTWGREERIGRMQVKPYGIEGQRARWSGQTGPDDKSTTGPIQVLAGSEVDGGRPRGWSDAKTCR
jgi:hypothetical protein